MATTARGIVYPTVGNTITPLANHFAALASSVDTALAISGTVPVADAAARAVVFPSPVQGNSVLRLDMGWEETYYGLYNSTTNPGGASAAGWYPTAGRMPIFRATGSATVSGGAGWTIAPVALSAGWQYGGFTDTGATAYEVNLPYAGEWEFSATADFSASASGNLRALCPWVDGTQVTDYPVRRHATVSGAYTAYETFRPVAAASKVQLRVNSDGGTPSTTRRTLQGRYLGPLPVIYTN